MTSYIPWKLVKSWRCLACGNCCRRYLVNLTREEWLKIGRLWPNKTRIKGGKFYLRRNIDGRCKFLSGKLCYLQFFNMKPLACKLWPFMVQLKPDKIDEEFEGLYHTGKKEYFVYLNSKCSGINRGNPADLKNTIDEIINLWNGSQKNQFFSTSKKFILTDPYLTKNKILENKNLQPFLTEGKLIQEIKESLLIGIKYGELKLRRSKSS